MLPSCEQLLCARGRDKPCRELRLHIRSDSLHRPQWSVLEPAPYQRAGSPSKAFLRSGCCDLDAKCNTSYATYAGLQDRCMLPAIVDARANERRDLSKTSRTFFAIVSQIIPGILVSWTENHRIPG